jgi:hypothetical protein
MVPPVVLLVAGVQSPKALGVLWVQEEEIPKRRQQQS